MAEKCLEVKTDRGNIILIPISNISFVVEGDRGINYIHLKDGKQPIETTRYIGALRAEIENE